MQTRDVSTNEWTTEEFVVQPQAGPLKSFTPVNLFNDVYIPDQPEGAGDPLKLVAGQTIELPPR